MSPIPRIPGRGGGGIDEAEMLSSTSTSTDKPCYISLVPPTLARVGDARLACPGAQLPSFEKDSDATTRDIRRIISTFDRPSYIIRDRQGGLRTQDIWKLVST